MSVYSGVQTSGDVYAGSSLGVFYFAISHTYSPPLPVNLIWQPLSSMNKSNRIFPAKNNTAIEQNCDR